MVDSCIPLARASGSLFPVATKCVANKRGPSITWQFTEVLCPIRFYRLNIQEHQVAYRCPVMNPISLHGVLIRRSGPTQSNVWELSSMWACSANHQGWRFCWHMFCCYCDIDAAFCTQHVGVSLELRFPDWNHRWANQVVRNFILNVTGVVSKN